MAHKAGSNPSATVPALLRLPREIRDRILDDVLTSAVQGGPLHLHQSKLYRGGPRCISVANQPEGFLLSRKADQPSDLVSVVDGSSERHVSLSGLLYACKTLHDATLQSLVVGFIFYVIVDVRREAPSGANSFAAVNSLNRSFREQIRHLAVAIVFIPKETFRPAPPFFELSLNRSLSSVIENYELSSEGSPLYFERAVENVNELVQLLPGCQDVCLTWAVGHDTPGHNRIRIAYAGELLKRLVASAGKHRQMEFSSQDSVHVVTIPDVGITVRERRKVDKFSRRPYTLKHMPEVAQSAEHYYVVEDGAKTEYVCHAPLRNTLNPRFWCSSPASCEGCLKCDGHAF